MSNCTTHHNACHCREEKLKQVLRLALAEQLPLILKGEDIPCPVALASYVEVNELWLELYGCELFEDGGN